MIESIFTVLLIVGTVIGAVGGSIGTACVLFPVRIGVFLFGTQDENETPNEIMLFEYPT